MPPKGWRKGPDGFRPPPTTDGETPATPPPTQGPVSHKEKKPQYTLDDLLLPRSIVMRIAKEALSGGAAAAEGSESVASIPSDGYLALQRSASVFISYLCAEANVHAQAAYRRTIMPADILKALEEVELAQFVGQVRGAVDEYEAYAESKKKSKDLGSEVENEPPIPASQPGDEDMIMAEDVKEAEEREEEEEEEEEDEGSEDDEGASGEEQAVDDDEQGSEEEDEEEDHEDESEEEDEELKAGDDDNYDMEDESEIEDDEIIEIERVDEPQSDSQHHSITNGQQNGTDNSGQEPVPKKRKGRKPGRKPGSASSSSSSSSFPTSQAEADGSASAGSIAAANAVVAAATAAPRKKPGRKPKVRPESSSSSDGAAAGQAGEKPEQSQLSEQASAAASQRKKPGRKPRKKAGEGEAGAAEGPSTGAKASSSSKKKTDASGAVIIVESGKKERKKPGRKPKPKPETLADGGAGTGGLAAASDAAQPLTLLAIAPQPAAVGGLQAVTEKLSNERST